MEGKVFSSPQSSHFLFVSNITQVLFPTLYLDLACKHSEDIEDRVVEKLPQEFSRTECRILGALSKLDEFLLDPQVCTRSGTVPGTFRNTNVENQEPNEDRSQDDPHPELGPPSISPVIQLIQTQTRLLTEATSGFLITTFF